MQYPLFWGGCPSSFPGKAAFAVVKTCQNLPHQAAFGVSDSTLSFGTASIEAPTHWRSAPQQRVPSPSPPAHQGGVSVKNWGIGKNSVCLPARQNWRASLPRNIVLGKFSMIFSELTDLGTGTGQLRSLSQTLCAECDPLDPYHLGWSAIILSGC